MFKNRITQYLTARQPAKDSHPIVDLPAVPAGFVAIPLSGLSPASSSLYEVARRAAIQGAREKLIALLRSRQTLIQGN